jgi:monoamine oxidase
MQSIARKMSPSEVFDVIIVGGGLSGLLIARDAKKAGKRWKVLEAQEALGGRLQNDANGNKIDMGGAWIWPRHQPLMKKLVDSLGIDTFLQPDDSSSTRIVGGAASIIQKIVDELQPADDDSYNKEEHVKINCPVVSCTRKCGDMIEVQTASGNLYCSKAVVIAAPPRITLHNIKFEPALSNAKGGAMSRSQTWMAGVTKVALVYRSPRFWPPHESSRGFSPGPNRPAFQVYDGSPEDASISVLTFFVLASLVEGSDDESLARLCCKQFCSSLAPSSLKNNSSFVECLEDFDTFHIKRWPYEKYISDDRYPQEIHPHPQPNQTLAMSEWDGLLLFAGSETDQQSPGVMEGAVGAAKRVSKDLLRIWNVGIK